MSPVSFSHNNVRLLMVYGPYAKFAYRATCRFRDKACTESDGQTDRQTDRQTNRQTDRIVNYTVTLAAHARGLTIEITTVLSDTKLLLEEC